jgi:hypothetical protein
MQALTVRMLIAKLQKENPNAIVLRATDGDIPAKPVCEIDKVSIKGVDALAVLFT